jgi:hypothetical protein
VQCKRSIKVEELTVLAGYVRVALMMIALVGAPTRFAVAQSGDIDLTCRYDRTLKLEDNTIGLTSGGFSAQLMMQFGSGAEGPVIMKTTKTGCPTMRGWGNALSVETECAVSIGPADQPTDMHHRLSIDRLSGQFEEHFSINKKAGLIHYGRCTVSKRVF